MKLLGWSLRKSRKTAAACSYCPLAKSERPRLKTSCSACEGASSWGVGVEAARTAAAEKGAKTSAAASSAAPIRLHVLKVVPPKGRCESERIVQRRRAAGRAATRETLDSFAQDNTASRARATRLSEGRVGEGLALSRILFAPRGPLLFARLARARDFDAVARLQQGVGHGPALDGLQVVLGRDQATVRAGARDFNFRAGLRRHAARGQERLRQRHPRIKIFLAGGADLAAGVEELRRSHDEVDHVARLHERVHARRVREVNGRRTDRKSTRLNSS